MKVEAKIFGIIPIILNLIDLNRKINITKIANKTKPKDLICDENNDESILLYNTSKPFILTSSRLSKELSV